MTDEVVYLSAMEEGRYAIAQANVELDAQGKVKADLTNCRKSGDFVMARPTRHRVRRRVAEAARLGGRGAHPVPRE